MATGGLAIIALVCACACAIGVGYAGCDPVDPDPNDAAAAAPARLLDAVFSKLRAGANAWVCTRMSAAFRRDWSAERVQRVVASNRALSTQTALHVQRVHYEPREGYDRSERCVWNALSLVATVDGALDTADGPVAVHAALIREAGTWRFKQIDVPDASIGGFHNGTGGASSHPVLPRPCASERTLRIAWRDGGRHRAAPARPRFPCVP